MGSNAYISICIITYKRLRFLKRLLETLQELRTDGKIRFSIVVVDNDWEQSAKPVVDAIRQRSRVSMQYCVEPEKNLALARNRAVESAQGTFVAFIDDDEFPSSDWLLLLYKTCGMFKADGVLGPVKPHFEEVPPLWIVKSGVLQRPSHPTGQVLQWRETRTGNVLLRKSIFDGVGHCFDPVFGRQGEDLDFFRRMIGKGYVFVWCDEAAVYETQPKERQSRSYLLRRALLRGSVAYRHIPTTRGVLKSAVAVCLYTTALPLLHCTGHHRFMKYLLKDCDHLGKLLAFVGVKVERWVHIR
jgi:glycosyltransferase involved in cell wall biosynthesis